MIFLAFLGLLSLAAIVATVRAIASDGYRRAPHDPSRPRVAVDPETPAPAAVPREESVRPRAVRGLRARTRTAE